MTIAIAEWIVYRFQPFDSDPEPLQYLEAAWAANIHLAYADEMEIVDDEWSGPVRGPISMALTFVIDGLFAEEADPNAAFNPAWATKFAKHVLPEVTAFNTWVASCLARLEAFYPAPAEEDLDWFDESKNGGALVPREVLDPAFDFNPAMTERLIRQFLAALDYQTNQFLRSPEEMHQRGFKAVPYRSS
jgi:hypothetical protein